MTQKMSQILIESEGKRKQTFGKLKNMEGSEDEIKYCALGAISCEMELLEDGVFLTYDRLFQKINEKLQVNLDLFVECDICSLNNKELHMGMPYRDKIGWMIIHWNDSHRLSFKEIGKKLEAMNL